MSMLSNFYLPGSWCIISKLFLLRMLYLVERDTKMTSCSYFWYGDCCHTKPLSCDCLRSCFELVAFLLIQDPC